MEFKTSSQVEEFEKSLEKYLRSKGDHPLPYIPLVTVFEISEKRNSFRLFYSALDLKINIFYLSLDLLDYSHGPKKGLNKIKPFAPVNDPEAFAIRADAHRSLSSFIYRYRAIWDKIFGFMILLLAPDEYKNFRNQKRSRKRKFLKIMESVPVPNPKALERVLLDLEDFEKRFRTPEAHDTGSLRKWTFTLGDFFTQESMDLIEYWNKLIRTLNGINLEHLSKSAHTTP